jgi:hypothetical protein
LSLQATADPARALGAAAHFAGTGESSTLHWSVAGKVSSNVLSLALVTDDHLALLGNELNIWPVAAIELAEDQDALVADLEGASARNLLEVRHSLIIILDQIVVDLVVEVLLRDHVLHDYRGR